MGNRFKVHRKNHTNYFFDVMINMKNLGLNKIKIDECSYKNILFYYIKYVTFKDFEYIKINSVNSLYHLINKINGYFESINENRYLTPVFSNKSNEIIKNICRSEE